MMRRLFIVVIVAVLSLFLSQAYAQNKEAEIGAECDREYCAVSKISTDPVLQARVEKVGKAIVAVVKRSEGMPELTYTFRVIEDSNIEASSYPGGYIYVFRGMLDTCKTDNELAFVLAHEIHHCAQGDGLRSYENAKKAQRKAKFLDILTDGWGSILMGSKVNSDTRDLEARADADALNCMKAAGYDQIGAVGILMVIDGLQKQNKDLVDHTHPRPSSRVMTAIEAIKPRFQEMANMLGLPADKARVIVEIKGSQAKLVTDKLDIAASLTQALKGVPVEVVSSDVKTNNFDRRHTFRLILVPGEQPKGTLNINVTLKSCNPLIGVDRLVSSLGIWIPIPTNGDQIAKELAPIFRDTQKAIASSMEQKQLGLVTYARKITERKQGINILWMPDHGTYAARYLMYREGKVVGTVEPTQGAVNLNQAELLQPWDYLIPEP